MKIYEVWHNKLNIDGYFQAEVKTAIFATYEKAIEKKNTLLQKRDIKKDISMGTIFIKTISFNENTGEYDETKENF